MCSNLRVNKCFFLTHAFTLSQCTLLKLSCCFVLYYSTEYCCNFSAVITHTHVILLSKWVSKLADQNVVETTDTRGIWRLRRQHLNRGHLIKFLLIRGGGRDLFSDGWWREKKHILLIWGSFEEGDTSLTFLH